MLGSLFGALVVENGLVRVRETRIPEWVDPEHLGMGIEQLNVHIENTIGYVTTGSELLSTLESFTPPREGLNK